MKDPAIEIAAVPELPSLSRLFKTAVNAHFSYFPEVVRQRVIREHSVPNLLKAVMDRRRAIVVARHGNRIIGYCLGAAPHTGPAQIYWLYVDPAYRGSGTGTRLLEMAVRLLRAKGAATISIATHDHRNFYEHQGFAFIRKTEVDSVDMDILALETTA